MMSKVMTLGVAGVLTLGIVMFANADEQAQDVKLKIEKVSLFKNGLGFISSRASLPDKSTVFRFGQLPVPSYGTFWVGYSSDVKMKSMVTSLETVEEQSAIQNIGQLLQLNAGRKVILKTGAGEKDVVEGTIIQTIEDVSVKEPPSPYYMDVRRGQDPYNRNYNYYYQPGQVWAGVVMIKTESGIVAVNSGSIIRADLEPGITTNSLTVKQKRPSIRMELEKPAKGEDVAVSCLARGITWVPSYLVDLSDAKTAKLSAKAVIINELADFDKVKLELVTGYPNIKFGELVSPTAMSQSLADFLTSLAAGRSDGRNDRYGNMMSQQAVMFNSAAYAEVSAPLPGYSTATEGTVSEDLFLYPVKDFTLKKGETAMVPLFTAEMPYKHIYTWSVADMVDKDERYRNDRSHENEKNMAEEVWHSCRLSNNLKMPLTTAAAEFMKDGQFTGQDICYFTAPGADTTIKINRAMNVVAEQAEFEVERQRNAAQFYGYSYDQVKVRGELKIKSRLDKNINMEITKELSGDVVEKSDSAKDVQTAKGLKQVNPRHILTWQIELTPGQEKSLSYVYKVYIRN